jgi:hypothetical protein
MDHRPFEDWLLDTQPLSTDQKHLLNSHLRTCSSCSAIVEVDLALNSVNVITPTEGFANRFQVRLAARKKILQWRNFWGFFVLTLSVLGLFAWVIWPVLQSPVNLLGSWISSLVTILSSFQAIFRAGVVLFKVVPGFVPAYIWAVMLIAAGGWSLVWIVSLMKITKYPQGV